MEDEVFKVKGVVVGGVYPTNSFGNFVVEGFYREREKGKRSRVHVDIRFIGTGAKKRVRADNILSGEIKDEYYPSVCGVGYLGGATSKRNKGAYTTWAGLLDRCYNSDCEAYQHYGGSGVTVAKEWHNFEVFLKYYNKSYIKGFNLDKDLLAKTEPKIYSPDTCCFLPKGINTLLGQISEEKGILTYSQQYAYGSSWAGSLYPKRFFPTKDRAYQYRAECFQDRLCNFLEDYSNVVSVDVVSGVTKILQQEIDKFVA